MCMIFSKKNSLILKYTKCNIFKCLRTLEYALYALTSIESNRDKYITKMIK